MLFLKLRSKQRGYLLLLLMLGIGSLALYLNYQFSLKKMNMQSWQLAKTATEFSYWFDIEQNYEQDYAALLKNPDDQITRNNYNNIQLSDLIKNKHYLPYGMARVPAFPNTAGDQVSEFLCSSLPGISAQNGMLSLSGGDNTCPTNSGVLQHCDLANTDKVYYACANNASTTQAQYYINANHISLGNNGTQRVGLGIILPTPGFSVESVNLQTVGAARGILPNNTLAQSFVSTLPGAAFNVYTTQIPQVNAIGIASYLSQDLAQVWPPNNSYSKIVDMGLVQSVDISTLNDTSPCFGWDATTGNKIGTNGSYVGGSTAPSGGSSNAFPPTCIRIDMKKYPLCKQIDVLYTMYRNYTNSGDPSQFYSYTDSYVQRGETETVRNIFLSQSLQNLPAATPANYKYTQNGSDSSKPQYTWLAYIVRCTQDNQ